MNLSSFTHVFSPPKCYLQYKETSNFHSSSTSTIRQQWTQNPHKKKPQIAQKKWKKTNKQLRADLRPIFEMLRLLSRVVDAELDSKTLVVASFHLSIRWRTFPNKRLLQFFDFWFATGHFDWLGALYNWRARVATMKRKFFGESILKFQLTLIAARARLV
jgi:hypothetical protein